MNGIWENNYTILVYLLLKPSSLNDSESKYLWGSGAGGHAIGP
jgi:hypothetical protein